MAGERAAYHLHFLISFSNGCQGTKLLMPATSYAQTLVAIGENLFCVSIAQYFKDEIVTYLAFGSRGL